MTRKILSTDNIHPAIRDKMGAKHADIVDEVEAAIASNDLVIVGMAQNPHCKRARKLASDKRVPYKYLEYGGYQGPWRRRNALKMWSGWPTFPMVFHKGSLIGGASELEKLLASGEIT